MSQKLRVQVQVRFCVFSCQNNLTIIQPLELAKKKKKALWLSRVYLRMTRQPLTFVNRKLGAVANYRHFFQTNDVRLSWNPLPLLQTNTYITCIWKKCWPRNAGIVYMMRYAWWCPALRSILGKACHVSGSTEGLFSCFFLSGVGAHLPPFVLRITDSASGGARSRRSRVSSVEDVDKLGLGHEASTWAKFVILWISSSPKRPGSHA